MTGLANYSRNPWLECAYSEFKGLDLRTIFELGDPHTLIEAVNVDVTTGRDLKTRDQIVKVGDLDLASVGLYVVGNDLHAVRPYGYAVSRNGPNGVVYDLIDDSGLNWSAGRKTLVAVSSALSYDNRPYLIIEYSTASGEHGWEHHWLPVSPVTFTGSATFTNGSSSVSLTLPSTVKFTPPTGSATIEVSGLISGTSLYRANTFALASHVLSFSLAAPFDGPTGTYTFGIVPPANTQVPLPFIPGKAAIVAANKVWASQRYTPDVWFSSTLNGPLNWTEPDDAGFLPTSTHVAGQQEIQGLGMFQGQLVVMFSTSMQVWAIATDPAENRLIDSVGGAGCVYPRSVVNVMGDLYYLNNGAFRSLTAIITTGQKKEGDIGAAIAADTRLLGSDIQPVSVWSPFRQQFMCFTGSKGYVYTASPESQVFAWTTYSLPIEVSEVVELSSVLYLRRRKTVPQNVSELWKFDASYSGEQGFSWRARFPFLDLECGHWLKEVKTFELHQEGSCSIDIYHSPSDQSDYSAIGTVNGSTTERGRVPMFVICETFSPVFYGNTPWKLGQVVYRYKKGGLL
jgi:hypothetical protein